MSMGLSVFISRKSNLSNSAELCFGIKNLQRQLQACSEVQSIQQFDPESSLHQPNAVFESALCNQLLVVLEPALIIANNLVEELLGVLLSHPQDHVVPADPRTTDPGTPIDYASLAGFERYIARRQSLSQHSTGRLGDPVWVFMVEKNLALATLPKGCTWAELPSRLPGVKRLANRTFVHSFANYQASDRQDMLALIPAHSKRLLDVGGGEGLFCRSFNQQRSGESVLVEPDETAAGIAQDLGLSVINATFDMLEPDAIGRFDCISFLDVLEHFAEPAAALRKVPSILAPGGHILLSVPNIGHWSVVQDLLHGRFDYLPIGILCCTHLRFFTEHSLRKLLDHEGFQIDLWLNQHSPMPSNLVSIISNIASLDGSVAMHSLETDSFHVLASVR